MNRRDVLKLAAVAPVGLMALPAEADDFEARVEKFHEMLTYWGLHYLHPAGSDGSPGYRAVDLWGLCAVEPNASRQSAEIRMYKSTLRPGTRGIDRVFVKEMAVSITPGMAMIPAARWVVRTLDAMRWTEITIDRRDPPLEPVVF
jgi:hypothetical protein